ncbi:hypothetical protein ACA910_012073 [Epithemia clementina (nom. ined.)]
MAEIQNNDSATETMALTANDDESAIEELERVWSECFSDSVDPRTMVDDTVASVAAAYGVAVLSFLFCLALVCGFGKNAGRPAAGTLADSSPSSTPVNPEEPGSAPPPTETTPLADSSPSTVEPAILLTRRRPYKETLPLFFLAYAVFFAAGGVRQHFDEGEWIYNVLMKAMLVSLGLSVSLLLGLGAMEYMFYLRSFRVVKAPLTYLWTLLILGSMIGPVFFEDPHYYAYYFLAVSFLYMILSAALVRHPGSAYYASWQVAAMALNCISVVVTLVLSQSCARFMGGDDTGCSIPCPLPIGVFNPLALFNALVFFATLLFGIGKLRQVKVEKI